MEGTSTKIKTVCAKSSSGKNLTGTPRHVRDLTADIHASVQLWNNRHLHGLQILREITQLEHAVDYSEKLQNLCNELEEVCHSLEDVVKHLEQIQKQIKVITHLPGEGEKLFKTWPRERFGQVAERIYKAYSEEAQMKVRVLENVAQSSEESWKMLHLAMWVHQVLLPANTTVLLECLLKETGHR